MVRKTFTGTVLSSSDANVYWMQQVVDKCTSGTRPSSPTEGTVIYETDTDRLLIYTTATTTWRQPWNMPWGYIASAKVTANQTGITAVADLTSLTATFTALSTRRYKYSAHLNVTSNTANDYFQAQIADAASSQLFQTLQNTHVTANNDLGYDFSWFETGVSGSITRKLRLGRAGASAGTLAISASSTQECTFLVEDIGPSGAPA